MSKDLGMDFEYTVRMFLGDKAFHIAGGVHDEKYFKGDLKSCIPVMRKKAMGLDTTSRHKEMLLKEIEELNELLKSKHKGNEKEIIISLFGLVGRLFGFDGVNGVVHNLAFYHQTYSQYAVGKLDWEQKNNYQTHKEFKDNIITLQKEVYLTLHKKEVNDQIIAGVLNTTEHYIKKLKNNL